MKSFTKSLFSTFELGEGQVHTALLRYNKVQDTRFTFLDTNNKDEVMDAVDATPYDGSGTRTGEAIIFAINELLSETAGRRMDVPGLVVVVTDGKSQDEVAGPSDALRSLGMTTIAVGIGNVDATEILAIAGSESKAFITESFDDLITVVLDEVTEAACQDEDECLVNNGGCSDTCNNTPGSYHCTCPEGLVIDIDLKTCIVDDGNAVNINECRIMNGGCSHGCNDTLSGYNCTCPKGYNLDPVEHKSCMDVDECSGEEKVCSHGCVNSDGAYFCQCPPSHTLSSDKVTCVARPGAIDCPVGYSALAHSCVHYYNDSVSYEVAESLCKSHGASIIDVTDAGVRRLMASNFDVSSWWAASNADDRANNTCSFVDGQDLMKTDCTTAKSFVCEIRREVGLMLFSHTWPNGAQGSLHLPTDVSEVIVKFPSPVKKVTAWFCSAQPVPGTSNREFKFTQNYIQLTSSKGQCEFTVDMKERFADYDVTVV
jgi:hypothetical protein